MQSKLVLAPLVIVTLTGCVAPQPQRTWVQTAPPATTKFDADRGVCTAEAYRAVGAPPSSGSGSSVTTFSAETSRGTQITGQATTTPQGQLFGSAAGSRAYDADARYNQALDSVFKGCMAQRGWSLR